MLIASVVMLTVLTVAVSSVVAVRTALLTQYYEQLAKTAGEAGVAYAKACLAKNGNVPLWTNGKPLTPSSDCAGNSLLNPQVQVLVVAGGGGGGAGLGGGGGGGGVVEDTAYSVTPGTYTVVVGAGGAGGINTAAGARGANSTFNATLIATGGGGGAGRIDGSNFNPATDGGSGGGGNGTYTSGTGTGTQGGLGIPGQGNAGGMGSAGNANPFAGNGGGGGGASAVGGNASGVAIDTGVSGTGGNGKASLISGNTTFYGAGGSGGRWNNGLVGAEGLTGGGKGASGAGAVGAAGMANTGGGGGGGSSGAGNGGNGGSGVVIVRYPTDGSVSATTTGGSVDSFSSGAYQVRVFRANGSLIISNTATPSCPANPQCAVAIEGNARSMFSIGTPVLDGNGKAIAIPNTGYVELLRESNSQVWRTYRQPGVQAVAVPDLCSGAATSSLGWSNAVIATPSTSLPNASAAQGITLSDTDLAAGQIYFRRDFAVSVADTYSVVGSTPNAGDKIELYVDGVLRTTAQGAVNSGSVALGVGCHTVTARLTNQTITNRKASFAAAIQRAGSTEPIVATNSAWRVSAGRTVDFSSPDFYADPTMWDTVNDFDSALARIAGWSVASDPFARFISSDHSGCPSVCPTSSYTYLRDSKDFITTSNVEVRVSALCDDDCSIYIDGNLVISNSIWSSVNQQTLTLTKGVHRLAATVRNAGAGGASAIAVSVLDTSGNQVLARTDSRWQAAATWFAGTTTDVPVSYESSFIPSPVEIPVAKTADILVAGGGGAGAHNSGGGGGGGGVITATIPLVVGNNTITVGAGGAGAASGVVGTTGGFSQFGSSATYRALGGGGGAPRSNSTILATVGGSGGGGAGAATPNNSAGANGTAGQGGRGGNGTIPDASCNARGGGGGGAGGNGGNAASAVSGNGGAGIISFITGSRLAIGGGGGGGSTCTVVMGLATDGGGSATSENGATNRAGGGAASASSIPTGGGGSGIVVVRIVQGSATVTALNGGSTLVPVTVTIGSTTYSVYTFTATSGTTSFNVTAVP